MKQWLTPVLAGVLAIAFASTGVDQCCTFSPALTPDRAGAAVLANRRPRHPFRAIFSGNPSLACGHLGIVNPFRNTCVVGTSGNRS